MITNRLASLFAKTCLLVGMVWIVSSCSSAHCPGVGSTGTYKPSKSAMHTYKGKNTARKCPGTASTGTSKPKLKAKKEDGLYSKKMAKTMSKRTTDSGTSTE